MNWFATYWLEPEPEDIKKLKAPQSMSFKARSYNQALDKVYDPHHKKYNLKLMVIDKLPRYREDKFRALKIYPELKQW